MCLFTGKSFHLLSKPGLLVTAMFVSDAFILGADLIQDFVEVLMGCGIHLHIDCASKLRAHSCQLLNNQGGKEVSIKIYFQSILGVMKQASGVTSNSNHYS